MIEYGERFRCFDCYYNNSYDHSYYCSNKKRIKELDIDNVDFYPESDGDYCDYYFDEEEHYMLFSIKKKCQKFLKGIYDIIELWKFKQEHWNIESLYGVD